MGNKSWQQLAAKARKIARRIINGDEEDYKGERLAYIVDRLDVFATDALNKKYANNGSVGSIHTYAGGTQVISTRHTDGSEGSFNTDGECRPTDNPMDIEVDTYINGGNGGGSGQSSLAATTILPESKTNKNMKKNTIKLNESQLKKIVAESVKKVLKESIKKVKITERAKQLLSMYASFGESSNEQFLEDALNVVNEYKDTAIQIINRIKQITNAYAGMSDNLDEEVANILNDIVNI